MSKNPKPTAEELEFVYGLMAKGYDDASVLAEYARLYEAGTIKFSYRTDKRLIRQLRMQYTAAQKVIPVQAIAADPIVAEARRNHFELLK